MRKAQGKKTRSGDMQLAIAGQVPWVPQNGSHKVGVQKRSKRMNTGSSWFGTVQHTHGLSRRFKVVEVHWQVNVQASSPRAALLRQTELMTTPGVRLHMQSN